MTYSTHSRKNFPVKRKSRIAERRIKLEGNVTYDEWKNRYVEKDVSGEVPFKKIIGRHTSNEDLRAVNPNYGKGYGYQINCQKCVPTYELRRRGYNVTAKPTNEGDFLRQGNNYAKCLKILNS